MSRDISIVDLEEARAWLRERGVTGEEMEIYKRVQFLVREWLQEDGRRRGLL